MDYIIYTTEGVTETKIGDSIENCQILDFRYDSDLTPNQCLRQYLIENQSEVSGFDASELRVAIRIDENVCAAMKDIVKCMQNNTCENESMKEKIDLLVEYFRL